MIKFFINISKFITGWLFRVLGGAVMTIAFLGFVCECWIVQQEPSSVKPTSLTATNDPTTSKINQSSATVKVVDSSDKSSGWIVLGVVTVAAAVVAVAGHSLVSLGTRLLGSATSSDDDNDGLYSH